MAKGAESKSKLFAEIQRIYPDAFWEDQGKILRVPMEEDGNPIEIKVVLTAAKTNIGSGELKSAFGTPSPSIVETSNASPAEMTEEEKRNVESLIAALNL